MVNRKSDTDLGNTQSAPRGMFLFSQASAKTSGGGERNWSSPRVPWFAYFVSIYIYIYIYI